MHVTRWLTGIGFPSVEPLAVEQPVASDGCVVTFWRYLPQGGPMPVPADLGFLLRRLHDLGPPPVVLPAHQPLVSARRAIASSRAIDEDERAWLLERSRGGLQHQISRMLKGWDILPDDQRAGRAAGGAASTTPGSPAP